MWSSVFVGSVCCLCHWFLLTGLATALFFNKFCTYQIGNCGVSGITRPGAALQHGLAILVFFSPTCRGRKKGVWDRVFTDPARLPKGSFQTLPLAALYLHRVLPAGACLGSRSPITWIQVVCKADPSRPSLGSKSCTKRIQVAHHLDPSRAQSGSKSPITWIQVVCKADPSRPSLGSKPCTKRIQVAHHLDPGRVQSGSK